MQLVAYGMQDVYLTGNSQITFFKNLYRRHTNFSCEAVEQTFQSNSKNFGNKLVAVISRNGDLLHRLWLEVELEALPPHDTDAYTTYVSSLGHSLIKSAEVEIGGQRIDKIYGRFTHLYHKLSCKAEKEIGYELMTGNDGPDEAASTPGDAKTFGTKRKLYIPLDFWFSKGSAGAALPLIALQYHEVRVSIELASADEIQRSVAASTGAIGAANSPTTAMAANPKLYSDFFYLDTDERRRFSQMSHEYLIEQLQFTGSEVTGELSSSGETPFSMRLNFNHPTKALFWTTEHNTNDGVSLQPFHCGLQAAPPVYNTFNTNNNHRSRQHDANPISSVELQLNGHERFSKRDGSYFSMCQPYQCMTRVPWDHPVSMYSFCLSPEEHQPSGALNFSRIDNATLKLNFKRHDGTAVACGTPPSGGKRTVYVYAVNYNVLRILSGMGGLAFSN
jgi:hypothetical protein